ncbi:MAG: hypothetical protein R6W77_00285 [Trueperaceae bacterium]
MGTGGTTLENDVLLEPVSSETELAAFDVNSTRSLVAMTVDAGAGVDIDYLYMGETTVGYYETCVLDAKAALGGAPLVPWAISPDVAVCLWACGVVDCSDVDGLDLRDCHASQNLPLGDRPLDLPGVPPGRYLVFGDASAPATAAGPVRRRICSLDKPPKLPYAAGP